MSRSKREKTQDFTCRAEWDSRDLGCPHICRLPLRHEEEEHYCCGERGGTCTDLDLYGDTT